MGKRLAMGKTGMAGHTHALPALRRHLLPGLSPGAGRPVKCVDSPPSASARRRNPALPTRMTVWTAAEEMKLSMKAAGAAHNGAGLGTRARQTGFRAQAARTGGLEARFIPRRNARVQVSSTQGPQVWFRPSPQVMWRP